jgi:hypothetical protein
MNKRIKELYDQSLVVRNDDAQWIFEDELNVEKFVELIVTECIDYCGENLSKTVGGALKIHFGVEK